MTEGPTTLRRGFVWLALALPVCGYLLSVGLAEFKLRGAPTITVAIEGFDPRDPFRGHYLQYRVLTTPSTRPGDYPQGACAGDPVAGVSPVHLRFEERFTEECAHPLPLPFVNEAHRFYIQQDAALAVERAVQEGRASVQLVIVSEESVHVKALLLDGKSWTEVVR